jgi:hypothetical protein
MALDSKEAGWLLKMIQHTREVELSCPDCAAAFDLYAQSILDGEPIEGVLTLVKQHLESCSACDEEFQLILETIKAIDADLENEPPA